jgi:hypothetical protein
VADEDPLDTRDRDLALLRAGVDIDNPDADLLVNGWRPEMTVEQIQARAEKLGVLRGTTAPTGGAAADPSPAAAPQTAPAGQWAVLPDGNKVFIVGDGPLPATITMPGAPSTTQINQPQQVPLVAMADARQAITSSQNQQPNPQGEGDINPYVDARRRSLEVKARGGTGIDAVAETIATLRRAGEAGDQRVIHTNRFDERSGAQPPNWDLERLQRRQVGFGPDLLTGSSGF